MTTRSITEDMEGVEAGDELAQLRMLVRALANQVICMALLERQHLAELHRSIPIRAETTKAGLALAQEALAVVNGESMQVN